MMVQIRIVDELEVTLPLKRNYVKQDISKAQTDKKKPALTSYSSLAMVSAGLFQEQRGWQLLILPPGAQVG